MIEIVDRVLLTGVVNYSQSFELIFPFLFISRKLKTITDTKTISMENYRQENILSTVSVQLILFYNALAVLYQFYLTKSSTGHGRHNMSNTTDFTCGT